MLTNANAEAKRNATKFQSQSDRIAAEEASLARTHKEMEDLAAKLSQVQKESKAEEEKQQHLVDELQKQLDEIKAKDKTITDQNNNVQNSLKDKDSELKKLQRELGKDYF